MLIPWLHSLRGTKQVVSLVIRAFFSVRSGPDERQSGVRKTAVPPEQPSGDPRVDGASGLDVKSAEWRVQPGGNSQCLD